MKALSCWNRHQAQLVHTHTSTPSRMRQIPSQSFLAKWECTFRWLTGWARRQQEYKGVKSVRGSFADKLLWWGNFLQQKEWQKSHMALHASTKSLHMPVISFLYSVLQSATPYQQPVIIYFWRRKNEMAAVHKHKSMPENYTISVKGMNALLVTAEQL